jgi:hypothetical protein
VQIGQLATTGDPADAADAAWAAGDTLHAAAAALGSRVICQAAAAYDRAGRAPYGRIPGPTPAGNGLRRAARLLSATAFVCHDRTLAQVALVARLAALADAVAEFGQSQQHAAQAAAARRAAEQLHTAAEGTSAQFFDYRERPTAATRVAAEAFPRAPRTRRYPQSAPASCRAAGPVTPSRRGPAPPGRRGPAR